MFYRNPFRLFCMLENINLIQFLLCEVDNGLLKYRTEYTYYDIDGM